MDIGLPFKLGLFGLHIAYLLVNNKGRSYYDIVGKRFITSTAPFPIHILFSSSHRHITMATQVVQTFTAIACGMSAASSGLYRNANRRVVSACVPRNRETLS